ncbi:MAG: transcriptional regulator [Actinomycetota bacterium]
MSGDVTASAAATGDRAAAGGDGAPADADSTPADLDAVIHAPKRLYILATLSPVAEAEFLFLQERLQLSASDLSKQMTTLREAGLVQMRKTGAGRGGKTWFALTDEGHTAFNDYRKRLRTLLD